MFKPISVWVANDLMFKNFYEWSGSNLLWIVVWEIVWQVHKWKINAWIIIITDGACKGGWWNCKMTMIFHCLCVVMWKEWEWLVLKCLEKPSRSIDIEFTLYNHGEKIVFPLIVSLFILLGFDLKFVVYLLYEVLWEGIGVRELPKTGKKNLATISEPL